MNKVFYRKDLSDSRAIYLNIGAAEKVQVGDRSEEKGFSASIVLGVKRGCRFILFATKPRKPFFGRMKTDGSSKVRVFHFGFFSFGYVGW